MNVFGDIFRVSRLAVLFLLSHVIVYTISSDATHPAGGASVKRIPKRLSKMIHLTFELLYLSANKSEWKRLNGACGTSKTESELENLKKN